MKQRVVTPEERRRRDKRRKYLKEIGVGSLVPAQTVHEHIKALCEAGMTCRAISELSGIHETRIRGIRDGYGEYGHPLVNVHRTTHNALMGVSYEPCGRNLEHVDPTGTFRRMQALRADGFPVSLIIQISGMTAWQIQNVAYPYRRTKVRKYIFRQTAMDVAKAYEAVGMKHPEDFGVPANLIARTKAYAARHGYAPRMAWDEDTIDDPDAFPEWTGECGTPNGYRLHDRRGIPACDPCRKAHSAYNLMHRQKHREMWRERKREQRGRK